ncbi:MAG: hypothetical protein KatS3mg111_3082 [Pirellulaceae bacterium]|nr:MAG: hypothetical protein KatS3mg111_3082 [Pirellulaceae bacterium]
MPFAIVLGSSPTGLYALRELSKSGFRTALGDRERGCAWYSRLITGGRYCGSVEDVCDWALRCADRQTGKAILIPTSDIFIEAAINRFQELSSQIALFSCYKQLGRSLLDKYHFYELCQQHGIESPRVWRADSPNELEEIARFISFPCILKPQLIHRARSLLSGKKVLIVRSALEMRNLLATMPEDSGGWLIQEIIPGPESEITLVAAAFGHDGAPLQVFSARKLRQYPAGFGSASLVLSKPCHESENIAVSFLRDIEFRGVCGVEFKRDPRDGRLKIIEINPRPTLWFQITHDCGYRILASACRNLLGLESATPQIRKEPIVWRYLLKDIASQHFYRRFPEALPFSAPNLSAVEGAPVRSRPVFQWSDPLPSLVEPVGFLRKAVSRWSRVS